MTLQAELKSIVERAKATQDPAVLGAIYKDLVGYDLHEDYPSLGPAELREFIEDVVCENCYGAGIHVLDVGLKGEKHDPDPVGFIVGGDKATVYSLQDMLTANATDEGLCEWLAGAKAGDRFPDGEGCEAVDLNPERSES